MKKTYITLSFVFAGLTLSAQNKDTQTADKLYNRYEYIDAAEAYLKLVSNNKADNYVYRQLADSYYNVFNTVEAAKWYAKATEEKQDAEIYYRYAQMLKSNAQYEEANRQMQTFAALAPNDQRAIAFKKEPNYIPRLTDQQKMFDFQTMDINSDKSDFGAVLTNDNTLYFASARNTSRKNYGWTDEPYLDLYKATRNADGTYSKPTEAEGLNSKWHDGPAVVTADGNTMYFSSETFRDKIFDKDKEKKVKFGNVGLFKATKTDGKWGNIQALPFNNKDYNVGNPSLSKDGKTLYFSSDMPGTLGGSDIWKVQITGDNTYDSPENLGDKINTEGRENFPFITDDNKLYFSSDSKQGFGGLDVFVVDLEKGTEMKNVGKPVNSEKDDFAFSFHKDQNVGFFSSNRGGQDDIYMAIPVCGVQLITTVKNAKTGEILSGAAVAILDDRNNVIETKTTAADGLTTYATECDKVYTLQVSKDGFVSKTIAVDKSKGGEMPIVAELDPIDVIITETEVILNDIFFEFNKSNITKQGAFELDKLVQVMKNNTNMVIMVKSHTDNRGTDSFNMNLSDRRAKATVQYVISKGIAKERIEGKGYGESEPKVQCTKCSEEEHAKNRRSEFMIVKK
ncbi:OmpA family protein [Flavobacterium saliperosum S13]|uniref:WD40-like Beta Propeller Repeat n=2 Tax=Flavobacterium saliperosum TaxID=329186 RepID=A0A1G4WB82_9FLAO|nr:OmpA family protein [Flavobacterium saliperosum]ESU21240.1 OmpA family protein [Flavobacterium saliperosum S13]SCX19279.1 WD40-like Beta Propeller Repeat [Flavobacterium saliperosum]